MTFENGGPGRAWYARGEMSGPDKPQRGQAKSEADQTLLGVAPPRIDSAVDSRRSPVFVRSGTSVADVEPAPLRQIALPSRPPPAGAAGASASPLSTKPSVFSGFEARVEPGFRYARDRPVVGMVLIPVVCSLSLIFLTGHRSTRGPQLATPRDGVVSVAAIPSASLAIEPPKAADIRAELERRPVSSLSSRELMLLAEARAQEKRSLASELRAKLTRDPQLAQDSEVQSQLLHLSEDPATAPDALAAMTLLEPPVGTDLLYELWTGTPTRTDTTELARALLYSTDVRPKASPALAVALDLRIAETCEQYQVILPRALTDGDRRAWHLLTKLSGRRGCGPKKTDDCFACLRAKGDELTATINAVKSRHAPSFAP